MSARAEFLFLSFILCFSLLMGAALFFFCTSMLTGVGL